MNFRKILLIAFVAAIGFFAFKQCSFSTSNSSADEQAQLIEALQDTIKTYKAKDGKTVTHIKTIEVPKKVFVKVNTDNDSLLQRIKEMESEINRLTDAVVLVNQTKFEKDDIPIKTVIEYRDTSNKEVTKEYITADYHDEWVDVDVTVNLLEESLSLDFATENSLEIWQERKPGKLFRQGHLEVFVKNENPYVRTPALRSYKVKEDQRRMGFGLMAGMGVDPDLKIKPFVGAGIMYRIL